MAEFKEVIHQFERMCEFYRYERPCPGGCHNCPLNGCGKALERCSITMFEKHSEYIEREIMKWAAEHPEPVYPTWYEWLASMGAIPNEVPPSDALILLNIGLFNTIPMDIVKRFGIKPKESSDDKN